MVNSFNEWDQLKEVIVGAGFSENLPTADFSFKIFFHDNLYGTPFYTNDSKYITRKDIDEHNEDIETFVCVLKSLGVNVLRPKVPAHVTKIKTNTFESTNFPALNPRDLSMIVGNEIIESSPICRYRYFENDYMKHIFMDYFNKGSKWVCAPKPLLLDSSFDLEYVSRNDKTAKDYYKSLQSQDKHPLNMGYEIMFDAACCMRLGSHILMNVCNKNSELGAKWLQSHLHDYTIWTTRITDWHIDSTFIPLRPGLALISKECIIDKLPHPIRKWDFIKAPDKIVNSDFGVGYLASSLIDINVLSINKNLIIANSSNSSDQLLSALLKPYKIDVIGTPMRHAQKFSGSFHCLTLDVVRDGILENYFD